MAYTDELFAELRRTLDRTVEEQVKRQVESMSLQISILTAQINALAKQFDSSPPSALAALSREQVTKLVSDALVRSLEGQPFTLEGAQPAAAAPAAPAAPAPAPAVPAAAPSTGISNASTSGQGGGSTSSLVAGAVNPPRPASSATPLGSAKPRPTAEHEADDLRLEDSLERMAQYYSARSSERSAPSSRPNAGAGPARTSGSFVARPPTSTSVAPNKRKSLGGSSTVNLFHGIPVILSDDDEPGPSRPRKSATTSATRVGASRASPEPWTGSIPAVKPLAGQGVWYMAALQWVHGGAGLKGPLKDYGPPSDHRTEAAYERRMIVGKEYERLLCAGTVFNKTYPTASSDSLGEISEKIIQNTSKRP